MYVNVGQVAHYYLKVLHHFLLSTSLLKEVQFNHVKSQLYLEEVSGVGMWLFTITPHNSYLFLFLLRLKWNFLLLYCFTGCWIMQGIIPQHNPYWLVFLPVTLSRRCVGTCFAAEGMNWWNFLESRKKTCYLSYTNVRNCSTKLCFYYIYVTIFYHLFFTIALSVMVVVEIIIYILLF